MTIQTFPTDPLQKTWDGEWIKYNQRPYFKPNVRLLEVLTACFNHRLKNKKILELGAGSGSDIISLTKKGAKGFALDFSQESIKTILYWSQKKRCKVNVKRGQISDIPYSDNYFDLVYSVGLMEHFKNPLPYLYEQIRIVKPGGFLVIDVPQKYTLYTIAKHARMFLGTHPFGWETEYSKRDLITLGRKLRAKTYAVYGRDSDVILRLPQFIRGFLQNIFTKTLETSFLAPYICLNIGLILQKQSSIIARK